MDTYSDLASCIHCRMLLPAHYVESAIGRHYKAFYTVWAHTESWHKRYSSYPCGMVNRTNEVHGKLGRVRIGEYSN